MSRLLEIYKSLNDIVKLADTIYSSIVYENIESGSPDFIKLVKYISKNKIEHITPEIQNNFDFESVYLYVININRSISAEELIEVKDENIKQFQLPSIWFDFYSDKKLKGEYKDDSGAGNWKISLYFNKSNINQLNDYVINYIKNKNFKVSKKDIEIMFVKILSLRRDTLVHELQHAYDSWRSGGKALSMKAKDTEMTRKIKELAEYWHRPHEIWARFAQVLLRIKESNDNSWDYCLRVLKTDLSGWEHITEDERRRLTKALYKYYTIVLKGE